MEEVHNFSISGKAAVTEANLRDEYFWKLLDDFLGPQTGEKLDLDELPCKNRLLIQVGLMREANHLTWSPVVEWLQKIFPNHQSADFQGLIEMGIATTLSLGSNARRIFLDSEVNFNFVGPICDSIGVERTDLVENRDFSERAKSIEVTNGLILEFSNFVVREKMDPIFLVSWLRNFNPLFCKEGNIQKAYKTLRPQIKKLKLHYRNYKTRSYRRNSAMENLLHSPFQLVPVKIEARKIGAKKRAKKDSSLGLTQSKETLLTESKVTESKVSDHESEDVKKTTANEKKCQTLLDVSMITVQKLKTMYGGETDEFKEVSEELLKNLYILMCNEHPDMKEFESKILSLCKEMASPFEFLCHNVHFLVDVHNAIEQELMRVEKEMTESSGERLGRDKNPKFKRFVGFTESATSRFINMACEALTFSRRGSALQNYRKHWVAFCKEKGNPSKLDGNLSIQSHRYDHFEAAAGLIHHHEETPLFFSDLLLMDNNDCPNIILESITCDAADDVIQSLVCALAVLYCKILGPYYQLLKSGGEYALFNQYILCLYQKILEWSKNPSTLLEPEEDVNVFLQQPLQERTFDRVFQYCGRWHTNRELIRSCLKKMVKAIAVAADKHLMDFLPGGKYSQSPGADICLQLAGCTFSTLMREYPFNQRYLYDKPRPRKSWEHSSNHLLSSSSEEEDDSSDLSDEESPQTKKACILNESTGEEFGGITLKQDPDDDEQHKPVNMDRKYVIATVTKTGGPCKTQQDVDKLLLRFEGLHRSKKVAALYCQLMYQKMVLDNDDPHLEDIFQIPPFVSKLATKLKLCLPRVKPGYSFTLEPRTVKSPKSS